MPRLTARGVATIKTPGRYGDGGGLYLRVKPSGSRSWILRLTVHGRRRDIGLGSVETVSLAQAREKAHEMRRLAREGRDPTTERKRETLTFEEAARRVHEHLRPTWRSAGHARRWLSTLELYAFPRLAQRDIATITGADVLEVLTPIWTAKHDTAQRVKQRIATTFDWAKGAGHYQGEKPAHAITRALPSVRGATRHMEALPWQEVPAFYAELGQLGAVSAQALRFIILTAARSGEARGARWAEIDMAAGLWIIPAGRMKTATEHRVPLPAPAVEILEAVRGLDEELLFPSPWKRGGEAAPLSDQAFNRLLRRAGRADVMTHGFRSSFRMWASDSARAPREVAEAALAHQTGSKVERAYARSDHLDRRREFMDAWARFVTGERGDVVELVRGGG